MKALLSIDYTNDFIADDGALTLSKVGQQIESALVKVAQSFVEKNDFVFFIIDAHDDNDVYHAENKLFRPHNINGTKGQELFGKLNELYLNHKINPNVMLLHKPHYSAFCGTSLDLKLRERSITELHLTGVCTDICILHTAIDAYNLGYNLVIRTGALASFNQIGHEWALNHFETVLGAKII